MKYFEQIDELLEYVPLGAEIDPELKKFKPIIEQVENKIIKKEIGKVIFDELAAFYAGEETSEIKDDAIKIIQKAVANLATAAFIPKHKVMLDSQGVRTSSGNDRQDAKPYDTYEAIQAYENAGWDAIEELLEFLDENIETFTDWPDSPECTSFRNTFIRTTDQLRETTGIYLSRRLFKQIKPYIDKTEDLSLKPIIGKEFYTELIESENAGDTTTVNKVLLPYIRRIVGFGALTEALMILPVKIDREGITVAAPTSTTNMVKPRSVVASNDLANIIKGMEAQFLSARGVLKDYLQKNYIGYPLFVSGGAYEEAYSPQRIDLDSNSKITSLL